MPLEKIKRGQDAKGSSPARSKGNTMNIRPQPVGVSNTLTYETEEVSMSGNFKAGPKIFMKTGTNFDPMRATRSITSQDVYEVL